MKSIRHKHLKNKNKNKKHVNTLKQCLGTSRTATIGKEKTTIVDGKGSEEAIETRAQEIKKQIDNNNGSHLSQTLGRSAIGKRHT